MANDAMQITVIGAQNLMQPMHQLDIRIASQLAKNGGTLDGLIKKWIELAKQGGTADLRHKHYPLVVNQ
jgi:hypothetical protein